MQVRKILQSCSKSELFLSFLADGRAASDPSALQDVFFRIGGAEAGSATVSLLVNSNNVILDDIWAWRADHGDGVGWTLNTADTGLVVNGDNVTAYGLFIEHYQKYEIIWNGNGGTDIFLQNEMPYDPPSQAAWMESPGVDGYPALKVGNHVTSFKGYGLGSYSFFNQGINIYCRERVRSSQHPPRGKHERSTHDLSEHGRVGWNLKRDQQYRWLVHRRQSGYSGHSSELPVVGLAL